MLHAKLSLARRGPSTHESPRVHHPDWQCGRRMAGGGARATIDDENRWRVAEMKITFWPGLLLVAVASAVPLNAHAVTVTIEERSLTADEICDARFVNDTPPY